MDFMELVKRRKSVRKYSGKPVPREVIDKCIEAARLAPSACNSQPWSFIVVDEENLKNELAHKAFSGIYGINSFAKKAPVLIVVITEKVNYAVRLGGYLKGTQYSLIDIGIACEHLILQAAELGVGTCWLGWFDEGAVKKIMDIPKGKKVDVIISMGWEQEKGILEEEKKRKPVDEIRHFSKG